MGNLFVKDDFNRLIAGGCAGGVAVFVGYPIDCAKVRIQVMSIEDTQTTITKNNYNIKRMSIKNVLSSMYQSDGIYAFYRGVTTPMVTSMASFGVLLFIYGQTKQTILNFNHKNHNSYYNYATKGTMFPKTLVSSFFLLRNFAI